MSTLDSDTNTEDNLKHRSYDIKMQRAVKRPRLTSTKIDEVQKRDRLAAKTTTFKPPQKKAPSPNSGRSSSSASQSDDDRNAALPSPVTSTDDDPMDLLSNNTHVGEVNGTSHPSPVSSVANGVRQISVARKYADRITTPATYHGKNYRQAKDIPTELYDHINKLDAEQRARMSDTLRLIFEAQMVTNTAHDEPDAPAIHIYNDVDDDPTPPFEFYYTNLMWHAEDVPPPDYEGLTGCDCIGGCKPDSTTCACIKRQRLEFRDLDNDPERWLPEGFMYNEKGILLQSNFPVIECNDACRCSDECMNRVGDPLPRLVCLILTAVQRSYSEVGNVT